MSTLKEADRITGRPDSSPRSASGTETRAQLPELLDRMTIAVESLRTQWRTLADLGIHERMAISQLRVHGSMPMSELAARISLSRAAVTSLVDRLEAGHWVVRVADDHDRRRTVLRLLPEAAESFDRISQPFFEELTEWSASMSDSEWRTIAGFLDRLTTLAERRSDELRLTAVERSLS
ncbi:MAG: putative DNA-binding protein [Thermoleophilia bacterium]|nr:putative DNA-binding protein [Thermoleophilia bacterium]